MKRCPECRRDYYDETLLYCLDDGNALLEGPASGGKLADEPATVMLPDASDSNEAKTRPQISTPEPASVFPDARSVPGGRSVRYVLMSLALAVIALGGFAGYRYLWGAKANQI